jgi:hypothetical protein
VLADLGYESENTRLPCPIKNGLGTVLTAEKRTINALHSATRALAERGNSVKTTFKGIRRGSLSPCLPVSLSPCLPVSLSPCLRGGSARSPPPALVLLHHEHRRTTAARAARALAAASGAGPRGARRAPPRTGSEDLNTAGSDKLGWDWTSSGGHVRSGGQGLTLAVGVGPDLLVWPVA